MIQFDKQIFQMGGSTTKQLMSVRMDFQVKELESFLAKSAAAPWRLTALHQPPQILGDKNTKQRGVHD